MGLIALKLIRWCLFAEVLHWNGKLNGKMNGKINGKMNSKLNGKMNSKLNSKLDRQTKVTEQSSNRKANRIERPISNFRYTADSTDSWTPEER